MAANSCRGKVALVTGASRGIGRAVAMRLASEGARVALVARDLHKVTFGRSLASVVGEIGEAARAYASDLSDPEFDPRPLLDLVEAELGPVDICVNNAAMAVTRAFSDWTIDDLRRLQQTNNWSPWLITQCVLPGMMARGRGWIVQIGSALASVKDRVLLGSSAYSASKAMLEQWSRVLAAELADSPIVLNCVAPQGDAMTEGVMEALAHGHIHAETAEPLSVMSEAVLALATLPPGRFQGQVMGSLEVLSALHRPAIDFATGGVVPGYGAAEIGARAASQRRRSAKRSDLGDEETQTQ